MTVGERAEDVFYLASLVGQRRSTRRRPTRLQQKLSRRARPSRRRVNDRLDLLAAYPFERLARLKAGATPPAGPAAHRDVHRRAAARAAGLRASTRCAQNLAGSTAIRRPPGCPRRARPARAGSSGASRCRGRDPETDGAAGERHARSAVRVRPGGGRRARGRTPLVADAEPVLPDLRRRGAAGRRRAAASSTRPRRTRFQPGSRRGAGRRSGSAASCCSCAAPAIPPAPCCRSTYLRTRSSSPSATTS